MRLLRLGNNDGPRIYIDAEPPGRQPVSGLDLIPDEVLGTSLKRAYQSALKVYAFGEPEATASACRRVLEGITKGLTPEATSRVLAHRIQELAKQERRLAKPIIDLSESLKDGGNLGAHFDEELETSLADAGRMLDLLDYLITYLFVIPEQIERFKAEVLQPDARDASSPE